MDANSNFNYVILLFKRCSNAFLVVIVFSLPWRCFSIHFQIHFRWNVLSWFVICVSISLTCAFILERFKLNIWSLWFSLIGVDAAKNVMLALLVSCFLWSQCWSNAEPCTPSIAVPAAFFLVRSYLPSSFPFLLQYFSTYFRVVNVTKWLHRALAAIFLLFSLRARLRPCRFFRGFSFRK